MRVYVISHYTLGFLFSWPLRNAQELTWLACVTDEVTDKRPIGQTTYMLSLTNSKEGILAVVDGKAPTGSIHIESVWTVYDDKITEEVTIDANMVMKKMIKGSVEKNHPGQHQGFVLAAKS